MSLVLHLLYEQAKQLHLEEVQKPIAPFRRLRLRQIIYFSREYQHSKPEGLDLDHYHRSNSFL